MNIRIFLKSIALVSAIGFTACQPSKKKKLPSDEIRPVAVYNFDDKSALQAYEKLNLDATHANLLNPNVAKDEMQKVIESWTDIHQKIGNFYKDKNFDWGVSDSSISVVDKIYFDENGRITSYFFNVLNENVDESKTEEFAQIITDFAKTHTIAIKKDSAFAQCGKIKYVNY